MWCGRLFVCWKDWRREKQQQQQQQQQQQEEEEEEEEAGGAPKHTNTKSDNNTTVPASSKDVPIVITTTPLRFNTSTPTRLSVKPTSSLPRTIPSATIAGAAGSDTFTGIASFWTNVRRFAPPHP
jgi:transcription initiation factor TFIID subunit TAF12